MRLWEQSCSNSYSHVLKADSFWRLDVLCHISVCVDRNKMKLKKKCKISKLLFLFHLSLLSFSVLLGNTFGKTLVIFGFQQGGP